MQLAMYTDVTDSVYSNSVLYKQTNLSHTTGDKFVWNGKSSTEQIENIKQREK